MTDRLTEIKARVANATNLTYKWGAYEMLADLKFALGEIERLQRERDLFFASVNEIGAERDRLRGLLKIAFSAWMRGPDGHIAQDDVNAISAALEERKS